MQMIDQVFPVRRQVPLEGLYLGHRLKELAAESGRSLVLTDFLTDQNGVVAHAAPDGHWTIPAGLKNASDWGRFQELLAQADIMISSGSYFKRLAGKGAQDVLYPFEPGENFDRLGQWRLASGYATRSPDVAIVTRHLDFELPERLRQSGRRIIIFTTYSMAESGQAKALRDANTLILGSGEEGVDGGRMIAALAGELGYGVIMMVSGPPVLKLLLAAQRLDLLYVTEAHVQVPFDDPAAVQTMLPGGRKIGDLPEFHLAHQYIQEQALTEDGSLLSQSFLRYDASDFHVDANH
jgi:riboflavin biosynthesis pyrimidine reductase